LAIIQPFCDAHLNDEYKDVCTRLAAAMCTTGSPVGSGQAKSWAAGIIWAAGRVNFLSDPAHSPTMKQEEFAKAIGVSPATISAKCRIVWGGLELIQFDPDFTIPSQQENNPLIWMVEHNGMILDLRTAPRDVQEAAYRQGLIPFVPGSEESE
jgi:hypothetical protein